MPRRTSKSKANNDTAKDDTANKENEDAAASTSAATPPAKKTKTTTKKSVEKEKWDGIRRLHFLGPVGTYSHQVAKDMAPLIQARGDESKVELVPCTSIWSTRDDAITRSKATEEVSYALLPYENNSNGPVKETYDTFISATIGTKTTLSIVEEAYLPVSHALLCSKKTYKELIKDSPDNKPNLRKIKKVLSHPQALGQCRLFVVNSLRKAKQVETFSTGEAALAVQKEDEETGDMAACIASKLCADPDICDLVVLEENIQNSSHNMTRFLLVESAKNRTHRLLEGCDIECDVWRMLLRIHTTATHLPISQLALILEHGYDHMQDAYIRNVHRQIDQYYKPHDIRDDGISDKHQIRERLQQGEWPYIYLVEVECRRVPTRPMPDDGEEENEIYDDKTPPEVLEEASHDIWVACNRGHAGTKVHNLGIWPVRIKRRDEEEVTRAYMSPTPEDERGPPFIILE